MLQVGGAALEAMPAVLSGEDAAARSHAAEVLVAFADPIRYGGLERRAGRDLSGRAADLLREAQAPEVEGALVIASLDEDRPDLAAVARGLLAPRR